MNENEGMLVHWVNPAEGVNCDDNFAFSRHSPAIC